MQGSRDIWASSQLQQLQVSNYSGHPLNVGNYIDELAMDIVLLLIKLGC